MRLVTVNLWNGRADPSDLARHLDDVQPDMLVAQEVHPRHVEVLASRFASGAVEGRVDTHGRALVSNGPIQVESLPLPLRRGYRGVFDLDGHEVEILSVHLANPLQGIHSLIGVGERRRQLEFLEPILSTPGRRLLVGDLNATPWWPAHRRLCRHLLDGIAQWAHESRRQAPRTWGPQPWSPALLRIDHVLVHGLRITSVRADRIAGGDHRAVTVDLEPVSPERSRSSP